VGKAGLAPGRQTPYKVSGAAGIEASASPALIASRHLASPEGPSLARSPSLAISYIFWRMGATTSLASFRCVGRLYDRLGMTGRSTAVILRAGTLKINRYNELRSREQ